MCDYDSDYTHLRVGFMVTSKAHECAACLVKIPARTRVRHFVGISHGDFIAGHVCPVCVFAERQDDHSALHICFGAMWEGDVYRHDGATDRQVWDYIAYCLANGETPTVTGMGGALRQHHEDLDEVPA